MKVVCTAVVVGVAVIYDKSKLKIYHIYTLKISQTVYFVSVSDIPSRATCSVLN